MNVVSLLKILIDPNICNFLCEYCAENLLDFIQKGIINHFKNKNETIEDQIVNALIDSYNKLCSKLKIECDCEFVTEIFIHYIYKYKNNLTIQNIKKITKMTLKNVEPYISSCYDISEIWENELVYIISQKYQLLKDYLILNKIWNNDLCLSNIKDSTDYIIENMKSQKEIMEQIFQKLSNDEMQNIYILLQEYVNKQISIVLEEM